MEPPPPPGTAKLRLMCSFGGHIVPRPRTKSLLWYAGGDTRIVSFHRHSLTTLSSFVSHLSSTLSLNFPFTLKYLLPHLDLHSLISLSSDDDLHILIDEHNRLSSSPSTTARIRLFVLPPVIRHPKTESWFFDALNSAKVIMQKGIMEYSDTHDYVYSSSGAAPVESMLLETSSSFGSTSSSASFTNLAPLRAQQPQAQGEEYNNETILKDGKVKLNSSDTHTIPSDNSISTKQQNIGYQDPVVHVSDARVNAESIDVDSKIPNISSGCIANNTNMDPGYTSFPHFNQVERLNLQFVQTGIHFLPLHPSSLLPVPSYQQQRPLQHMVYHPNQPCPVYLLPIGNMPPNILPINASLNLNASFMNCHVAHNWEVGTRSQNYVTDNATASFVQVPYNASQQQEMDIIYPMHHHSKNISTTSRESPMYGNEVDDELAHVQIYKSQPPPPTLPSKYQSMTKATTNLLSEAYAQLHVDNLKLQTETSQPQ